MLPTFLLHPRLVNKATITRFHTETQISSPLSLATLLPHYGADAVANLYRGTVPVSPGHHKPFSRWIGNMLGTCDLQSLPALTCWPASTQLVTAFCGGLGKQHIPEESGKVEQKHRDWNGPDDQNWGVLIHPKPTARGAQLSLVASQGSILVSGDSNPVAFVCS